MIKKAIPTRGKIKILNAPKKSSKKSSEPLVKKASIQSPVSLPEKTEIKTRPGARLPTITPNVTTIKDTDVKSGSVINTPAPNGPVTVKNYRFEIGSKFMLDTTIFTVKAAYSDMNTEFRKVWSLDNGMEIIELSSLMKDKNELGFKLIVE